VILAAFAAVLLHVHVEAHVFFAIAHSGPVSTKDFCVLTHLSRGAGVVAAGVEFVQLEYVRPGEAVSLGLEGVTPFVGHGRPPVDGKRVAVVVHHRTDVVGGTEGVNLRIRELLEVVEMSLRFRDRERPGKYMEKIKNRTSEEHWIFGVFSKRTLI